MKRWGWIAALVYAATIVMVNVTIAHFGQRPVAPGAPHTLPVLPGLDAPSGVYLVGLALVMRNVMQRQLGRWVAVVAVLIGAGLSAVTASADLAFASGVAFLCSELLDMTIYTPLRERFPTPRGQLVAVLPASLAGAALDSLVFLKLAFHSETFWRAQMVGKTWGVLAAAVVLITVEVVSMRSPSRAELALA